MEDQTHVYASVYGHDQESRLQDALATWHHHKSVLLYLVKPSSMGSVPLAPLEIPGASLGRKY